MTISEVFKGDSLGSAITITVPGGFDPNNENITLHLYGAPTFYIGEQVLLFLVKHKGLYFVQHFALGAFHQVEDEAGTSFATRAINDRKEDGSARNIAKFKDYIRNEVKGTRAAFDYYDVPADNNGFRSLVDRYNLFYWGGYNVRWFDFDNGNTVNWYTYGQQLGINGGKKNK